MTPIRTISFAAIAALGLGACAKPDTVVVTSIKTPTHTVTEAAGSACPVGGDLGPAYDARIKTRHFDAEKLELAILHFTNQRRCDNGIAPLSRDTELSRTAGGHSADMARLDFFGHNSPVPGKASFVDRLRASGVSFKAAAENLAHFSRVPIDTGEPMFAVDKTSCQFSFEHGGALIKPHSYRSLAKRLVDAWENSPDHRVNLFNPDYRRLGTGSALKPTANKCDDIYATQNFSA